MKRTLVTLALGVAVTSLEAQTSFPPPPPPTLSGPYIGASVGYAQAKNGCLGFLSGGGRACDDNDLEWGLLARDNLYAFTWYWRYEPVLWLRYRYREC